MRLRRGGQPIICRDESANRNAREFVEEREHGLPYRAADQFEIDVDTIGAGGSKLVGEARRAMIDRSIEAKLVDEIGAFLRAAGNPHDPAALDLRDLADERADGAGPGRSEEHTSELQSLMRISYAVLCLNKKSKKTDQKN